MLYVVQLERQFGEASIVGGYSGEAVTRRREWLDSLRTGGWRAQFMGRAGSPDRPATEHGRVGDPAEAEKHVDAVQVSSQSYGRNWRAIAGFTLIRGDALDFPGAVSAQLACQSGPPLYLLISSEQSK